MSVLSAGYRRMKPNRQALSRSQMPSAVSPKHSSSEHSPDAAPMSIVSPVWCSLNPGRAVVRSSPS